MENNPLISVIVPCYNQAEYLDECLHSILYQTYQNWECIIVNDGSPDNTEEIALKWVDKDIRFRYIKKEKWRAILCKKCRFARNKRRLDTTFGL